MSRPNGEFNIYPLGHPITWMEPVETTRRNRLKMLAEQHGGMANLCEKLGFSRKETSGLSRIANANIRHERGGEIYVMGSPMARRIEVKLALEPGWMDTPPAFEELDPDPRIANLLAIARSLKEHNRNDELEHLVRSAIRLLNRRPSDRTASNQPEYHDAMKHHATLPGHPDRDPERRDRQPTPQDRPPPKG